MLRYIIWQHSTCTTEHRSLENKNKKLPGVPGIWNDIVSKLGKEQL